MPSLACDVDIGGQLVIALGADARKDQQQTSLTSDAQSEKGPANFDRSGHIVLGNCISTTMMASVALINLV